MLIFAMHILSTLGNLSSVLGGDLGRGQSCEPQRPHGQDSVVAKLATWQDPVEVRQRCCCTPAALQDPVEVRQRCCWTPAAPIDNLLPGGESRSLGSGFSGPKEHVEELDLLPPGKEYLTCQSFMMRKVEE
jgi:hypothetical protein